MSERMSDEAMVLVTSEGEGVGGEASEEVGEATPLQVSAAEHATPLASDQPIHPGVDLAQGTPAAYPIGGRAMLVVDMWAGLLRVPVQVIGVRKNYGRVDYQVRPFCGVGDIWVQEKSLAPFQPRYARAHLSVHESTTLAMLEEDEVFDAMWDADRDDHIDTDIDEEDE